MATYSSVAWFARHRGLLVAALALNLAVSVLVALPVLPVGTLAKTPIADINQAVSDQIGWPVYVRQITDVYAASTTASTSPTRSRTTTYGSAAAPAGRGRSCGRSSSTTARAARPGA